MSVIIAIKVFGDTNVFRKAMTERADEFRELGETLRSKGAIHHQYALTDGYGLLVDEWESKAQWEAQFNTPEIQAFIASVGGDLTKPPEVTVGESVDTPDRF